LAKSLVIPLALCLEQCSISYWHAELCKATRQHVLYTGYYFI